MVVSSVAKELAAKIAPPIQEHIISSRREIIRSASPAPVRVAISVGFPVLVNEVPPLIESGCDALLDLFGGMTITQIATCLIEHNQSKGRDSHATLRVFANATS